MGISRGKGGATTAAIHKQGNEGAHGERQGRHGHLGRQGQQRRQGQKGRWKPSHGGIQQIRGCSRMDMAHGHGTNSHRILQSQHKRVKLTTNEDLPFYFFCCHRRLGHPASRNVGDVRAFGPLGMWTPPWLVDRIRRCRLHGREHHARTSSMQNGGLHTLTKPTKAPRGAWVLLLLPMP